jgi:hypothetical protein
MFRNPPRSTTLPSLSIGDGEPPPFADGFFFAIRQSALDFGANRRTPRAWRPGLVLWRREPAVAVLPSTTRNRRNNPRFFPVPPGEALFRQPDARQSFLYWRYETLGPSTLGQKIGMVSHPVRIQVMEWLITLYTGA